MMGLPVEIVSISQKYSLDDDMDMVSIIELKLPNNQVVQATITEETTATIVNFLTGTKVPEVKEQERREPVVEQRMWNPGDVSSSSPIFGSVGMSEDEPEKPVAPPSNVALPKVSPRVSSDEYGYPIVPGIVDGGEMFDDEEDADQI